MKLMFAGAEKRLDLLMAVGVKNILMSYYYMEKMGEKTLISVMDKVKKHEVSLMVDSGAHTFFTAERGESKESKHTRNPEEFLKKYTEWLKVWKDYLYCYVELDIGSVVGMEKIYEWRELMWKEGLKPLLVYHPKDFKEIGINPADEWEKMINQAPYLATQGRDMTIGEYYRLVSKAHRKGIKVHGFALTNADAMKKIPFHSVDSTSWLAGSIYGVTYVYRAGRMLTYSKGSKHVRKGMKRAVEAEGISYKDYLNDDRETVDMFHATQWKRYGEFLNKRRTALDNLGSGRKEVEEKGLEDSQDQDVLKAEDVEESASCSFGPEEEERIEDDGKQVAKDNSRVVEETVKEGLVRNTSEADVNRKQDTTTSYEDGKEENKDKKNTSYSIMEQRKNPEIEKKRIEANRLAMQGNAFHFIDGRKSKRKMACICGETCYAWDRCMVKEFGKLCAVRRDTRELSNQFDTRNIDTIKRYLLDLFREQVERYELNAYFETADGGQLDKNVSQLAGDLFEWGKILNEIENEARGGEVTHADQVNIINVGDVKTLKEYAKFIVARERGKRNVREAEVV